MNQAKLTYDYCMALVGKAYGWGGDGPLQFDCSGLVQEILRPIGMDIPGDQTAQMLYNYFIRHGNIGKLGFGSIAFFGKSDKEVTHTTFLLSEWQMIEAGGGGSKTISLLDAQRDKAMVRIRPLDTRHDLVGIIMPKYPFPMDL